MIRSEIFYFISDCIAVKKNHIYRPLRKDQDFAIALWIHKIYINIEINENQ